MPTNKKILSYLGFAAKARKVLNGYNTCLSTMEKGKGRLLILAEDLSENSKEKMISKAKQCGVKYIVHGDSDEMSRITGTSGKSIFCITDENFKKVILEQIDLR